MIAEDEEVPWWLGQFGAVTSSPACSESQPHRVTPEWGPCAALGPTWGHHSSSEPKALLEPLLHGFNPFLTLSQPCQQLLHGTGAFPGALTPSSLLATSPLGAETLAPAPSQSAIPRLRTHPELSRLCASRPGSSAGATEPPRSVN